MSPMAEDPQISPDLPPDVQQAIAAGNTLREGVTDPALVDQLVEDIRFEHDDNNPWARPESPAEAAGEAAVGEVVDDLTTDEIGETAVEAEAAVEPALEATTPEPVSSIDQIADPPAPDPGVDAEGRSTVYDKNDPAAQEAMRKAVEAAKNLSAISQHDQPPIGSRGKEPPKTKITRSSYLPYQDHSGNQFLTHRNGDRKRF
jgi:hypothetical protein